MAPIVDLSDKKVTVVGAARTGRAAARFLNIKEARVTLLDHAEEASLPGLREEFEPLGVRLILGRRTEEPFLEAELVVMSPGVPFTLPEVQRAEARGIPVVAEIELASWFIPQPIVAITGTNGKTTTTTIIGHVLRRWGMKTFVGGNIGRPLVSSLLDDEIYDVLVVEVSSFQLEGIRCFRPSIGVLLNLSPDHLDRYPDYSTYVATKGRLFSNQDRGDVAILNADDPDVLGILNRPRQEVLTFSLEKRKESTLWYEGNSLILNWRGEINEISLKGIGIVGLHNVQNIMASLLAVRALGCPMEAFQEAIKEIKGLEHRMEPVAEVEGVLYVNDSKATNVGALVAALNGLKRPVILIAGGRDKGTDFSPLREVVARRVKALILMGEARERLKATLNGTCPIHLVEGMHEAVSRAHDLAEAGDVVLLSPACASFDLYRDYTHRGEDFRKEVLSLKERRKGTEC